VPRSSTRARSTAPAARDALEILKADHQAVKKLFASYQKLVKDDDADDQEKQDLAHQICSALTVHARLEEEIFYPALRRSLEEQDLLDEAEVEHATAKDLIAQIRESSPGDELYDAKVVVLGEYIDHHVEEEEGEMFKKAKKADVDLAELGSELEARRPGVEAEVASTAPGALALDDTGADDEDDDYEDDEEEEEDDEDDEDDQELEEDDDEDRGSAAPGRRRRAQAGRS
jgi:hemerythrin-like domain-containing protein